MPHTLKASAAAVLRVYCGRPEAHDGLIPPDSSAGPDCEIIGVVTYRMTMAIRL